MGISKGGDPLGQCILRAAGTERRAGSRPACRLRGTQAAGHSGPQGPSHCLSIRESCGSVQVCPAFSLGQGVPFPGKRWLQSARVHHPQGLIMGLPSFPVDLLALGGQPQIPCLPAPVYLSPLPPEVNWFAPEFTFSSSPLFSPPHVASIKVKPRHGKTPHVTFMASVSGCFVFPLLVHPMGWTRGPCVLKWNNTSPRRKRDSPSPQRNNVVFLNGAAVGSRGELPKFLRRTHATFLAVAKKYFPEKSWR